MNVTSLKSSLMVNNIEQTAVVMGDLGFLFVCFCHNMSALDCLVARVSAESHCAPSHVLSVHPLAFAK